MLDLSKDRFALLSVAARVELERERNEAYTFVLDIANAYDVFIMDHSRLSVLPAALVVEWNIPCCIPRRS